LVAEIRQRLLLDGRKMMRDVAVGKSAVRYEKTVVRTWKYGKNLLLLTRARSISGWRIASGEEWRANT
jgi:hypothetical protein